MRKRERKIQRDYYRLKAIRKERDQKKGNKTECIRISQRKKKKIFARMIKKVFEKVSQRKKEKRCVGE